MAGFLARPHSPIQGYAGLKSNGKGPRNGVMYQFDLRTNRDCNDNRLPRRREGRAKTRKKQSCGLSRQARQAALHAVGCAGKTERNGVCYASRASRGEALRVKQLPLKLEHYPKKRKSEGAAAPSLFRFFAAAD